jgi:hypothetical protein
MAPPDVLQAELNRIWNMISRATAASIEADSRTVWRAITNISSWCNMTPEQSAKHEIVADAVKSWVEEVQSNFWKTGDDDEHSQTEALVAHLTAFETILEDVEPSSIATSLGLAWR